ncbi:hypothetical protein [Aeromicrobium wangtongii]|uniref:hypothetical protein n=1 Tax=Aeromicrobium wangtongii TaxID=2969247 RepID=UPI0020173CF0|nr:hypothetical protein [Aeromicrobium wangtongii]MCL3819329.1 hypothetical protein [Aeromicrobium wangtongii]
MVTNTRRAAHDSEAPEGVELNPIFAVPGESTTVPKFSFSQEESLQQSVYQIVHDEAMLDGSARLDLATFVGTWMDEYAGRLFIESADKNMVDNDEYPQTASAFLADLREEVTYLEALTGPMPTQGQRSGFYD